jgi:EAL domain-containing protein (putative c-di-GMP-specific phosphodiesterase class I)
VAATRDEDYFELRTNWLRLKGQVFDALTGLPSLPAVMEEVRRLLESQHSLEVLYVDLGRSGWQENKLGWAAYDTVVKGFAGLLGSLREEGVLEPSDVVCLHTVRSDRFLVFLGPRERRGAGSATRREEVVSSLRALLATAPADIGLRSIRVALGHARIMEHPLARPERAIHQAVSDAILRSLTAREGIEATRHDELGRILAMSGVRTVFHPIVRIADATPVGYEALTRVLRPSSFDSVEELFAFAESTEMLLDFERLCRGVAIRSAAGLGSRGLLFLNASARAILDPEWLAPATSELLAATGRSSRDVVVEVTERMAVERHEGFPEALRRLKEGGYRVAIDDMGAGHASLQTLAAIEPDYLKFDVTLVRDIDKSSIKRSLLETLRGLAVKMNARVIAEGIEREAERATLASLGIELGQGFLFHREATP